MTKVFSIFIFALLISLQGKGEVINVDSSKIENESVRSMSAKDQWVYLFIIDMCRNGSFPSFRDSISQSFQAGSNLWSLDTKRLQAYYKRGMTSTHIEAIFSSSATPIALEKCFKHMDVVSKAERKERFLFELMFWDYIGNHFGLISGTVGIGKLFGALFSSLNRFAWQPFKNFAKMKWKLSDKQLKWLDGFLVAGGIGIPAGIQIKDKYDENRAAENYEIEAYKKKLELAKEVKSMISKIEIQIETSEDKNFWSSAKDNALDQLNRLCRELNDLSSGHETLEHRKICL